MVTRAPIAIQLHFLPTRCSVIQWLSFLISLRKCEGGAPTLKTSAKQEVGFAGHLIWQFGECVLVYLPFGVFSNCLVDRHPAGTNFKR